jgi:hypothetical protein
MKRFGLLTIILVAALAFGLTLSACSKPADDEITAAENALKKAQAAGADAASPRLYEKAKDLLAEAKRANDGGNYADARKKAEFALMRAEQAGRNAEKLGGVPPVHSAKEPKGTTADENTGGE